MDTYQVRLDNWFREEQKKGLVDVKFVLAPTAKTATVEELCKEAYEMFTSPTVKDPELI